MVVPQNLVLSNQTSSVLTSTTDVTATASSNFAPSATTNVLIENSAIDRNESKKEKNDFSHSESEKMSDPSESRQPLMPPPFLHQPPPLGLPPPSLLPGQQNRMPWLNAPPPPIMSLNVHAPMLSNNVGSASILPFKSNENARDASKVDDRLGVSQRPFNVPLRDDMSRLGDFSGSALSRMADSGRDRFRRSPQTDEDDPFAPSVYELRAMGRTGILPRTAGIPPAVPQRHFEEQPRENRYFENRRQYPPNRDWNAGGPRMFDGHMQGRRPDRGMGRDRGGRDRNDRFPKGGFRPRDRPSRWKSNDQPDFGDRQYQPKSDMNSSESPPNIAPEIANDTKPETVEPLSQNQEETNGSDERPTEEELNNYHALST